jgi:hypothetical protein
MPRLKHSIGTALAAWRNPSECHLNRIAATIRIWILQYTTFLRSNIFRQVTTTDQNPRCIPGGGGAEFRNVQEHLWNFFLNPRCTFIRAYNVHCNTNILAPVLFIFFWTLGGGGGGVIQSTCRQPTSGGYWILKLLLCTGGVTAKERTGPRHFFDI